MMQSRSTLEEGQEPWLDLADSVTQVSGQNQLIVKPQSNRRFFRLMIPPDRGPCQEVQKARAVLHSRQSRWDATT
jgi:hypothetical protein